MKYKSDRKCANCGHAPSIPWFVSPEADTPKDKIHVVLTNESYSFFCNGCGHFTILCRSQSEYEARITITKTAEWKEEG